MNITEFAREIGVSPTTVSHALNGRRHVSAATRELIQRKMDELGYTPNLNAQRLVKGRSHAVALDWISQDSLISPYEMEMVRELQHALQPHGYNLQFNVVKDRAEQDTLITRWKESHAVDAIIAMRSFALRYPVAIESADDRMPCVVIGFTPITDRPYVASVVKRLEPGLRAAAELLVKNGHREIGFMDSYGADEMSRLVQRYLQEIEPSIRLQTLVTKGVDIQSGRSGLRQMMALQPRPTAILIRSDLMAMAALHEARQMNLEVPRHLSIIGFGDISLSHITAPPLTTVDTDRTASADAAVQTLLDLLNGATYVAPRWVDTMLAVRESVGPVWQAG